VGAGCEPRHQPCKAPPAFAPTRPQPRPHRPYPTPPPTSSPPAASEALPVCPTCLDPITHGHSYHLACLARSRARIPNPRALPNPVAFARGRNTAVINPLQNSEPDPKPATTRSTAPPPSPPFFADTRWDDPPVPSRLPP
jgi:hypothetical protein